MIRLQGNFPVHTFWCQVWSNRSTIAFSIACCRFGVTKARPATSRPSDAGTPSILMLNSVSLGAAEQQHIYCSISQGTRKRRKSHWTNKQKQPRWMGRWTSEYLYLWYGTRYLVPYPGNLDVDMETIVEIDFSLAFQLLSIPFSIFLPSLYRYMVCVAAGSCIHKIVISSQFYY